MKPQAFKTAALAGLVLLFSLLPARGQARPEERLFQEAKLLLFDEQWERALEKLETLLEVTPASPLTGQALFYKAKCLGHLEGREPEAVATYKAYLSTPDRNPGLVEEAEVAVIDLAYELYVKGNRSYLPELESRLKSSDKVVRYYAAFKLSYARDRAAASKSLPVLRSIVAAERDAELRDRAKIALMRVDPQSLRDIPGQDERPASASRMLRIQITEDGRDKIKVAIPWALADLAIQAIPPREKQMLLQKGYDLDRIMKDLGRTKSSILEISEDEGRTLIKIWID